MNISSSCSAHAHSSSWASRFAALCSSTLSKRARVRILLAYLSLIIFVMLFHEPWFDEAQGWLIARDSSWYEMLLIRPHYEGHPPLWTLLLSIPAKLGVPYEIGLKGVQLLSAALLGGYLIFRAPLHKVAVLLLPFTYFFCFQYGVTSRPYAFMCLALLIAAENWRYRDNRPWKLTLALIVLCLLSAYGIALAGGFALAWLVQTLTTTISQCDAHSVLQRVFHNIFFYKSRLVAWILLAVVGVLCLACIWPYADAFGSRPTVTGNPTWLQVFAFFFILPSESMITAFAGDVSVRGMTIEPFSATLCTLISIVIWLFALRAARRRGQLLTLILPYVMFAAVASQYFTLHHVGLIFIFLLAQVWLYIHQQPLSKADIPHVLMNCANKLTSRYVNHPHSLIGALIALLLLPSLVWNITASINDIIFDYSGSRALAQFIKDRHLERERWGTSWIHFDTKYDNDGKIVAPEFTDTHQHSWQLITANPYFKHNLLDCSYQNRTFLTNQMASAQQAEREIEQCAAKGEPAFFVTNEKPWYYFQSLNYNIMHYRPHTIAQVRTAWRLSAYGRDVVVYERIKDIPQTR